MMRAGIQQQFFWIFQFYVDNQWVAVRVTLPSSGVIRIFATDLVQAGFECRQAVRQFDQVKRSTPLSKHRGPAQSCAEFQLGREEKQNSGK